MTDSRNDHSSSLLQATDGTSSPNSTATPPLPWAVAAVWGSFLHEGLMLTSNNVERTLLLLDRWGGTTLALVQAVCEYLPTFWEEVQPYYSSLRSVPGVFEYEVVSQLGEQIATHLMDTGKLPSQEEFELMVRDAIAVFYLQNQEASDHRSGQANPSSSSAGRFRSRSIHRRWLRAIEKFLGGRS